MDNNKIPQIKSSAIRTDRKPKQESKNWVTLQKLIYMKPLQILGCSGFGFYLIAASYNNGGSGERWGRHYSWGWSINPLFLAIGVIFILAAWLIYKKWTQEKET